MSESAQERIFPFLIKKTEAKTALVAGGAGFIGSHICDQLIYQGFSVICVDNLTSGSKDNIKHLLDSSSFAFVKADINSSTFSVPPELKIDIIFHAAGIEEFSIDKNLSLESLFVNSLGARILLDLAKAKGAEFVFISTADLYSGVFSSTSLKYYFGKDPKSESTFTHNEAKRFAEALVFEYFKKYDLPALVVRVKDVYGPRMNLQAEGELNRFIREVTNNKKLIISGDGLKTVTPTFISDISTGIVKAALVGSKGEIYNLVNPDKITLNSLAEVIKQVVGGVEITHKSASDDLEPPYHQLDLSTSLEKLDWRPKIGLADGVSETIAYFRRGREDTQKKTSQPLFLKPQSGSSRKTEKGKKGAFLYSNLRIIIFLASLALVAITIVYPGAALMFNTNQANTNFKEALQNLEVDRVKESKDQAQKAEFSYKRAAQNLQNLVWLLQIFAERDRLTTLDEFYFIGEKLSGATLSTASALEVLINQTSIKTEITEVQLQEYLQTIGDNTQEAKLKLNLVTSSMTTLEEDKLPNALIDDLNAMKESKLLLEELVGELSSSTAP